MIRCLVATALAWIGLAARALAGTAAIELTTVEQIDPKVGPYTVTRASPVHAAAAGEANAAVVTFDRLAMTVRDAGRRWRPGTAARP